LWARSWSPIPHRSRLDEIVAVMIPIVKDNSIALGMALGITYLDNKDTKLQVTEHQYIYTISQCGSHVYKTSNLEPKYPSSNNSASQSLLSTTISNFSL
jgi:hypothetical protein